METDSDIDEWGVVGIDKGIHIGFPLLELLLCDSFNLRLTTPQLSPLLDSFPA